MKRGALARSLLRAGRLQQRAVTRAVQAALAPGRRAVAARRPTRPAAPGAAVGPASGKWLAGRSARAYWLYLPHQAPGPWPLIIMLHGCDQSATEFAQGTRMNQLAGRAGCAVLYPQQLRGTQARRCWRWFDRATLQGGGDAAAIMAVLRQVQERHRIDPARIYLAGLSAGAALAHIVALNHPRTFAALGLHSGPLFGAGHGALGALSVMRHGSALRVEPAIAEVVRRQGPFPALPAILIQGTHDPVVRPVNQEQLLRQLMLVNGLPDAARTTVAHKVGQGVAYAVRDVYAGRKVRLRVVTIDQLGHAWSGGDARLPFHSSGGPEASRMMLQFFRRHRRLPG